MAVPDWNLEGVGKTSKGVSPGQISALLKALVHAPHENLGSEWDRTLRPGMVVGRFELVREVGRGGFGVVYEAKDRELGRTVAFKAVRAGDCQDARQERLFREAEAAARLSHPNIVTLFDVGQCESGPYLVLELLRGRTLAERLEEGSVPLREALRIGMEAAKGLAHAHAEGVVHRDLTPGNVYLCQDGQVKVLDLGMAHAFGRRKVEGGTPAYMAPEQRRGAPEDERTDVFALGVLLYRMLADEAPFPADASPSHPSRPAPELHVAEAPALGALLARMLEKDPVDRPRDAGEVLSVLAACQAQVERIPSEGGEKPVRRRRRSGLRMVALAAAFALVGALVATAIARRGSTGRERGAVPAAQTLPSIAVLPFADMSPQGDQGYFSDGVAEEILNALAHVQGLRVAGRTSSFYFKGKSVRLADIGRELKVGTLLEGSVRKDGNHLRITAQLVNVADGYHLWSETYDRQLTSVFAVQDDISRAVVRALKIKLLPGQGPASIAQRGTRPEAYDQFLLGRMLYNRGSADGYGRAVEAFEKTLALDSGYAPAWAGLAVALNYAWSFTGTPANYEEHRRRSVEAATRARALDPGADGFRARGYVRAVIQHDWTGAEEDMERALALNRGDADTWWRYALFVQAPLGHLSEAIQSSRRATELDPLSAPCWNALGLAYSDNGQFERGVEALRRAVEVRPDHAFAPFNLTRTLLAQGQVQEALAAARGARNEVPRLAALAIAEHDLGHEREAQRAIEALIAGHAQRDAYWVAQVYGWWGDRDRAMAWLERAFDQRDRRLFEVGYDLSFRKLHGDPAYQALLGKMRLPGN